MTMTRTGLLLARRLVGHCSLRPSIQSALLHCASTSQKLSCWSTSRTILSTDLAGLARRHQTPIFLWRQQYQCFSSKNDDHDFASQLIHESREGSNPLERADRPSASRPQGKATPGMGQRSPSRQAQAVQFSSASSKGAGQSSSSTSSTSSSASSTPAETSKSSLSLDTFESSSPAKPVDPSLVVEEKAPFDMSHMRVKSDDIMEEQMAAGAGGGGQSTKADDAPKHDDDHKELEEKRKRLERTNKNTKRAFMVFATIIGVGSACFVLYYAIPDRDDRGDWIPDEFSRYPIPLSNFYRVIHQVNLWKDYVKEPSREDLLPPPLPAPYIQPKYTLVIELKNVLLAPEWSYSTGWRFKKRPAIEYFLDTVGYPNFEVVIYTSEPSMTAAPLIDSFDPKQRIMYRCYRDCTKYMKGHHVKDLSKLRRDMSKVIMMDHDPQSFQLNPENALRIPSWNGDMNDTSLVDLAELLKTIFLSDVDDVRPTLQYYSQFDDPAKEFRRRATYLAQQELEQKKTAGESQYNLVKNYAGRLFGYRRHS